MNNLPYRVLLLTSHKHTRYAMVRQNEAYAKSLSRKASTGEFALKEGSKPALAQNAETPSLGVSGFWWLWTFASLLTLVCLIPVSNSTSLLFPHLHIHMDKTANTVWVNCIDEGLEVLSYFATDLNGFDRLDYNYQSLSRSSYRFDYTSWCRESPDSANAKCYRGKGLDVISNLITDIAIQIGEAGRVEHPDAFGRSFAKTFTSTIEDINAMYRSTKNTTNIFGALMRKSKLEDTSLMDTHKLLLVHKLCTTMEFGHAMLVLKIVQSCLLLVACVMFSMHCSPGRLPHGTWPGSEPSP